MKEKTLMGPWVRRFLLEHLVANAIFPAIRKPVIVTR